ncbi:MAG: class I SAM-dependent methyltransferase [Chloroflexota bacterium]
MGTNTVYLAEKGFEVTGIDISPTAIKYAKKKASEANVKIHFIVQDFLQLHFENEEFDLIYDMGCFHYVEPEDRTNFIKGIYRILKKVGNYMLTCFSYRNGRSWNYLTKGKLINLFSLCFDLGKFRHYSSVEDDEVIRYFYTVLMKKK